jgi:very-short-patch-repair endonuclease
MTEFHPRNTHRARTLRHSATPAERHLWTALRNSAQGAKFSRQMPLGPYFADFLCRDLKLVIELDGMSHETSADYDQARDAWMTTQGYRVLRFANADVLGNLEGVAIVIRAAVLSARQEAKKEAHP